MDKPYTSAEAFVALRRDVMALGAAMCRSVRWKTGDVTCTEKRNEAEVERRRMRSTVESDRDEWRLWESATAEDEPDPGSAD